jgi:hypothetical protein
MEGSGGKESINTLILNQNVFESTLRLNGSPSKGSVLPSPRYFISPNKNRELVVAQTVPYKTKAAREILQASD